MPCCSVTLQLTYQVMLLFDYNSILCDSPLFCYITTYTSDRCPIWLQQPILSCPLVLWHYNSHNKWLMPYLVTTAYTVMPRCAVTLQLTQQVVDALFIYNSLYCDASLFCDITTHISNDGSIWLQQHIMRFPIVLFYYNSHIKWWFYLVTTAYSVMPHCSVILQLTYQVMVLFGYNSIFCNSPLFSDITIHTTSNTPIRATTANPVMPPCSVILQLTPQAIRQLGYNSLFCDAPLFCYGICSKLVHKIINFRFWYALNFNSKWWIIYFCALNYRVPQKLEYDFLTVMFIQSHSCKIKYIHQVISWLKLFDSSVQTFFIVDKMIYNSI